MTDCCCDPPWEFSYSPPTSACPGDDDCSSDCSENCRYGEITSCGTCAHAPRRYTFNMGNSPCFDCCPNASGDHVVSYVSSCLWASDTFACDADTYRWELDISGTPSLELVRTAGSGTLIEVVYEASEAWDCLCNNLVDLFSSDNCDDAKRHVCVRPMGDFVEGECTIGMQVPQCWEIVLVGFTNPGGFGHCTNCTAVDGTYQLEMGVFDAGILFSQAISTAEPNCVATLTVPIDPCPTLPGITSFTITISFTDITAGIDVRIRTNLLNGFTARWLLDADDYQCGGAAVLDALGGGTNCTTPATVTLQPVDC